jgi:nucleotide-binding universal stress UspA family protein
VTPPDATEETVKEVKETLDGAVARITQMNVLEVDSKIIRHTSVSVGIIQEAKNYDAVVVGAAGHSIYPQILFGSIPENIAKRSDRPVIVVKHYHPVKALIGRVVGE